MTWNALSSWSLTYWHKGAFYQLELTLRWTDRFFQRCDHANTIGVGSHDGFWHGIGRGFCAKIWLPSASHSFEWEICGVVHIVNHAVDLKSKVWKKITLTQIPRQTAETRMSPIKMGLIRVKTVPLHKKSAYKQRGKLQFLGMASVLKTSAWKTSCVNPALE